MFLWSSFQNRLSHFNTWNDPSRSRSLYVCQFSDSYAFQSFLISWSQWTRPIYDQHPEPEAIIFRRPENKWLSFRSTNFKHWPSSPFIKSKWPLIWSLKISFNPKFMKNYVKIRLSKNQNSTFSGFKKFLNTFQRITFDYILRYPTISQQDEAN